MAEIEYQPGKCDRPYRLIICRKTIDVEVGGDKLWDEYRYFFYITNDRVTAGGGVGAASQRTLRPGEPDRATEERRACAMKLPVDNLISNWAYMVMASLGVEPEGVVGPDAAGETGRWSERQQQEKQRRSCGWSSSGSWRA